MICPTKSINQGRTFYTFICIFFSCRCYRWMTNAHSYIRFYDGQNNAQWIYLCFKKFQLILNSSSSSSFLHVFEKILPGAVCPFTTLIQQFYRTKYLIEYFSTNLPIAHNDTECLPLVGYCNLSSKAHTAPARIFSKTWRNDDDV